jgi:hypothetical protein
VQSGRVSLDNLREALWMILLADRSELLHTRARSYPIPRGVDREFRFESEPPAPSYAWSFRGNSAQTLLKWAWLRPDGGLQAEGDLLWGSYDLAEAHAADLIEVAEQGFSAGCPPARLPSQLPRITGSVSALDASRTQLKRTFEELSQDLEQHRPMGCPTP